MGFFCFVGKGFAIYERLCEDGMTFATMTRGTI